MKNTIRRRAYHEAGHALMAHILGLKIYHANLKTTGIREGEVLFSAIPSWKKYFPSFFSNEMRDNLSFVKVCMAGIIAETLLTPTDARPEFSHTDNRLCEKHYRIAKQQRPFWVKEPDFLSMENVGIGVINTLSTPENVRKIRKLARALVRHGELTGEEIEKILAE